MFQQSLVSSGGAARKTWSFLASLLAQTLAICLVVLGAMAYTPLLPAAGFAVWLEAPAPPPGAPPPPPEQVQMAQAPARYESELKQPPSIPDKVAVIVDPEDYAASPPAAGPVVGGDPGGGAIGVIGSYSFEVQPPPPPQPKVEKKPAPPPPPSGPVRVSQSVQAAKIIRRVQPAYPQIARQAGIGGKVRLRAIISRAGEIEQLQVLSGHPFLVPAAVQAVKQWRYRPTLLSGEPVQVATEIEVNFVLSR